MPTISMFYGILVSIFFEDNERHKLLLEFENGEKRLFDMMPILYKRPFNRLKGALFMAARVEHGTVVWPGNIDIAPETLYDRSVIA